MHSVNSVFAEHRQPKHASKRAVHDQLSPIMAMAADVQRQVIEYRAALVQAQLSDDSLAPNIEHMYQTFGAIDREVANLVAAGRALAQAFTQLDRYIADAESDVARRAGA